jgi:ligand-binding sensor domain-containing protein
MNRFTNIYLIFFLLLAYIAKAQPLTVVGGWESFISYNFSKAVAASDNTIFSANELCISSYNLDDYTIRIHNKITGLSDMGISTIAFNRHYNVLIIAYTNGNIDLMKTGGRVVNRPAIKMNTVITGDKSIKHIFCDSNQVYFSTDFGLVNFDMELEEFGFNTFTPSVRVKSSARMGNYLYISTNLGIYRASQTVNLLDFNNWERMGTADGLFSNNFESQSISFMNGALYADVNDTIMRFDGSLWAHIPTTYLADNTTLPFCYSGYQNFKMQTNLFNSLISISTGNSFAFVLDSDGKLTKLYFDPTSIGNVYDAVLDRSTSLWTANQNGLHRQLSTGGIELVALPGPYTNRFSDMAVSDKGTLWCAGSIRSLLGPQYDRTGVYRYGIRNWNNFNEKLNNELLGIYDINSVAIHPKSRAAYFGSLMSGIIRITTTDSIQIIDKITNPGSTLDYATGNPGITRVAGLAFDEDENLWMANNLTFNPIVVWKKDGSWLKFPFSYAEFSYMTIDRFNNKWILRRDGQVTVYDSGDDIDIASDDRAVTLNSSNSNLGGNVTSLAADRNGSIWVGTSNGVTIYNCNVFEGNCPGLRPVINPDNFNGRLLEAENVRSIAVDGANRKWVGTDNGVFLLDAENYEQIQFYNEDNSPLFSNRINKITVDGEYGMVYIASEKGLQGYRAETTDGSSFMNRKEVIVFPNPVRPEQDGPVSIKNLAEDANVKITDLSGNLVFEQQAFGGQAVWNLQNYLGQPAAPGVYLVFVVNDDGTQKMVTKFVIVR